MENKGWGCRSRNSQRGTQGGMGKVGQRGHVWYDHSPNQAGQGCHRTVPHRIVARRCQAATSPPQQVQTP